MSDDDDDGKLATITILALLCVCCMGCCLCFCCKVKSDTQREVRLFRRLLLGIISNHMYAVVPEHISVHEIDLESFFPRFQFGNDLSVKNEVACCICFEEFNSNSYARKLLCGHVFHDSCIDEWFKRQPEPRCPLCKSDPFLSPKKPNSEVPEVKKPRVKRRGETLKPPNIVFVPPETEESGMHSFSSP
ncbi:unnamed protein product [Blepharisma stoltei]|uniref:RING-type domain-containing protein n=1 Tax=Blepharisma stoltei TaxID=1481888 RepID=A0AAU9J7M0_9CILI|nr:unnamed protein product [Blepharisma stoltei]